MDEELQKIYDSEINVRIESFWDGGWRVGIRAGNLWVSPDWTFCDLKEVIPALQELIIKHLPDSSYAKQLSPNTPNT